MVILYGYSFANHTADKLLLHVSLWTCEMFSYEGVFNVHSSMSGIDNPDTICKCQYVVHFINIGAGIIMDPYMLTNSLTAQQY